MSKERQYNKLPIFKADIFFFNELKKSLHSRATELFFKEVKGKKSKLKTVSYYIGVPKV